MSRSWNACKHANCVDHHNPPRLLSLLKCSYCDDIAEKISRVHRRHPRSAILKMSLVSCCSVSNQAAVGVVPGDRWLFLCDLSGWVCLVLWNPCADCRRVLSVVQGFVPDWKRRGAETSSQKFSADALLNAAVRGLKNGVPGHSRSRSESPITSETCRMIWRPVADLSDGRVEFLSAIFSLRAVSHRSCRFLSRLSQSNQLAKPRVHVRFAVLESAAQRAEYQLWLTVDLTRIPPRKVCVPAGPRESIEPEWPL